MPHTSAKNMTDPKMPCSGVSCSEADCSEADCSGANCSAPPSVSCHSVQISHELSRLADASYRDFAASLLPGVSNILGVRLPGLRKLAKRLAKEDWEWYLAQCTACSFEEIMLKGFLIGYGHETASVPLPRIMDEITLFLPWIDNWSVCDSFCITLKAAGTDQEAFWDYLQPLFQSEEEFTLRFAVVMLLDHYINDAYIHRLYPVFDSVCHPGYYVKMAVAWAVSMCYVRFPCETERYLASCQLDDFTYNKALQKITESRCVDAETKEHIRELKRRT